MITQLIRKPAPLTALIFMTINLTAIPAKAAPPVGGPAAHVAGASLPSFEVVSIKLCKSPTILGPSIDGRSALGIPHVPGIHLFNGRFTATASALSLVHLAYGQAGHGLGPDQITGAEGWVRDDLYDIEAKVDDSLVDGAWKNLPFDEKWNQVSLMVRSMLIDRFDLEIRHVTRVRSVYELVLAKNGPKFKEDHSHPELNALTLHGRGKLEMNCAKFSLFSGFLSFLPELDGRVVLDETGLTGTYSFNFEWKAELAGAVAAMGSPPADGAPLESSAPSLFTALQEQLGLKLVPAKAPVDVLVIDHIERPTEN